jgi:hypothetical protein
MTKPRNKSESDIKELPLSQETLDLIDHIAELLAEEFVKTLKKQEESGE